MAHSISGLIGRFFPLQVALRSFPVARVITLPQQYGFVPISHALIEVLAQTFAEAPSNAYGECLGLVPPLIAFASHLSHQLPLAYIETEYFGGIGQQSALVWHDGQVVLGPLLIDTSDTTSPKPLPPLSDFPINQVLHRLGVQPADALDEFEALGLHQHRFNDVWLDQTSG
jgi:hypothetical protein